MTADKSKRGGARSGAGRKPGAVNKVTKAAQEHAAATGEMPLDFMLRLMRDGQQEIGLRADMAKAAAGYVHPKLSAVTLEADVKATVNEVRRTIVDPEHPDRTSI